MLAAVGHEVVALHRDTFGPLELTGVECGQWRILTDQETKSLLLAAGGENRG